MAMFILDPRITCTQWAPEFAIDWLLIFKPRIMIGQGCILILRLRIVFFTS